MRAGAPLRRRRARWRASRRSSASPSTASTARRAPPCTPAGRCARPSRAGCGGAQRCWRPARGSALLAVQGKIGYPPLLPTRAESARRRSTLGRRRARGDGRELTQARRLRRAHHQRRWPHQARTWRRAHLHVAPRAPAVHVSARRRASTWRLVARRLCDTWTRRELEHVDVVEQAAVLPRGREARVDQSKTPRRAIYSDVYVRAAWKAWHVPARPRQI